MVLMTSSLARQMFGAAHLFDGLSLELLKIYRAPEGYDARGFGRVVLGSRDTNANDSGDILLGVFEFNGPSGLFDGATGDFIQFVGNDENFVRTPAAWVPNVPSQGEQGLLVGSSGAEVDGLIQAGRAHLLNLASATRIYTFYSPAPVEFGHFGSSVVGLEDIDGDALGDAAIRGEGKVYLFNGATGELIRTLVSPEPRGGNKVYIFDSVTGESVLAFNPVSRIGYLSSMAAIPDVNGDGVADIAIGTAGEPPAEHGDGKVRDYHSAKPGFVDIYNGATGEHLFEIQQPGEDYVEFAASLLGLRDRNGDGLAEIVVGAPGENRVYVYLSPFDRYIAVGEEGDGEPEAGGEGQSFEGDGEPEAGGEGQSSEGDGEPEAGGEGDPDGRPPILICTPFLQDPSNLGRDPGDLMTLFLMAGFLFRIHRTV